MTDHTPEPWKTQEMPSEIECRKRGDWIMLSGPDWFRAQACVNACAGIPTEELTDLSFYTLSLDWKRVKACLDACAGIPTKQLGDVKALVGFAEGFERYCRSIPAKLLTPGLKRQLFGARAALAPFRKG